MRFIASVVLVAAFTRCIVVVHGDAQQQVRGQLGVLRQQILLLPKTVPRVPCRPGKCYLESDVARMVGRIRSSLPNVFPEEAIGLREAVDAAILKEVARLGPPQELSTIQPVRLQEEGSARGYSATAVEAMLQRMAELIEGYRKGKLALDVTVRSNPPNADFMIQIRDNELSRRTARTNKKLENVWRGVYRATVQKSGFKEAVMELDLLNEGPTRISCTLIRTNDAGTSECRAD